MYPLVIALTFLIDIVDVAMPFPLLTDTPYDTEISHNNENINEIYLLKIGLIVWLFICFNFISPSSIKNMLIWMLAFLCIFMYIIIFI
jgi:hypothetical protein